MMSDKLSEHLKGLAEETNSLLKNIPLSGLDAEIAEHIKSAQNALDFSKGESIQEKTTKLNSTLNAISNYKRSL